MWREGAQATMVGEPRATREVEVVLDRSSSIKRKWRVEGRGHVRSGKRYQSLHYLPIEVSMFYLKIMYLCLR